MRAQILAGVRRLDAATSSGVPAATIVPPRVPPSGPRSMIQSAVLMTSRLCSMTSTVLPRSTSRCSTSSSSAHVLEVQAGRRLVEDVERAPGVALRQLGRELHALRLAAGERRRALAEVDVAEPDVVQRLRASGGCAAGSRRRRSASSTVSSSTSAMLMPAEAHLERLAVVALPLAHLARHVDVGEEVHLDLHEAVALARLAAAALHVEARSAPARSRGSSPRAARRTARGSGVNSPVYVAGFERGVRPIGLWSMSMTLSMCSSPVMRSCAPGMTRAR